MSPVKQPAIELMAVVLKELCRKNLICLSTRRTERVVHRLKVTGYRGVKRAFLPNSALSGVANTTDTCSYESESQPVRLEPDPREHPWHDNSVFNLHIARIMTTRLLASSLFPI